MVHLRQAHAESPPGCMTTAVFCRFHCPSPRMLKIEFSCDKIKSGTNIRIWFFISFNLNWHVIPRYIFIAFSSLWSELWSTPSKSTMRITYSSTTSYFRMVEAEPGHISRIRILYIYMSIRIKEFSRRRFCHCTTHCLGTESASSYTSLYIIINACTYILNAFRCTQCMDEQPRLSCIDAHSRLTSQKFEYSEQWSSHGPFDEYFLSYLFLAPTWERGAANGHQ